jgi:hypothetical protein
MVIHFKEGDVTSSFNSIDAINYSERDNAEGGYCAKGVANILERMGLDCTRGHARDWDETLPENGWIKIEGLTPETAPPGAVLVYDNDAEAGKANRGTGGGTYGHVEIVAEVAGTRRYVSDAARRNFGGTVPDNFEGAYIHPSMMTPEQAREYGVTANQEADGSYSYAREIEPDLDQPLDTVAFDGISLSEMFNMVASIFVSLFQGMSMSDAFKEWTSPDEEVGNYVEDPEEVNNPSDQDLEQSQDSETTLKNTTDNFRL